MVSDGYLRKIHLGKIRLYLELRLGNKPDRRSIYRGNFTDLRLYDGYNAVEWSTQNRFFDLHVYRFHSCTRLFNEGLLRVDLFLAGARKLERKLQLSLIKGVLGYVHGGFGRIERQRVCGFLGGYGLVAGSDGGEFGVDIFSARIHIRFIRSDRR